VQEYCTALNAVKGNFFYLFIFSLIFHEEIIGNNLGNTSNQSLQRKKNRTVVVCGQLGQVNKNTC
tara:strand:+ start:1178 stop:1372 length:195 start_codon:yes stop_codon:yes gene_type:complete